jgi:hypothetical protein
VLDSRFLVRWFEQIYISLVPNNKTSPISLVETPFNNMSRSAVSPRVFQPYSPRRPSPLGLPPFTPRGSQDVPCSAYPKTPERYYLQHHSAEPTSHGMRFPPDVHRRTQRTRASPPAPLSLDSQYHPAALVVQLPSIEETVQPHSTQEMRAPPSPTPSSTSSLSLYSTESAKKSMEIGQEEEGKGRKKGGGFCLCFSAYLYSILLQLIDILYYSRLLDDLWYQTQAGQDSRSSSTSTSVSCRTCTSSSNGTTPSSSTFSRARSMRIK